MHPWQNDMLPDANGGLRCRRFPHKRRAGAILLHSWYSEMTIVRLRQTLTRSNRTFRVQITLRNHQKGVLQCGRHRRDDLPARIA